MKNGERQLKGLLFSEVEFILLFLFPFLCQISMPLFSLMPVLLLRGVDVHSDFYSRVTSALIALIAVPALTLYQVLKLLSIA